MKTVSPLSIEALLLHYGADTVPIGDRWRKMRCILPDHDDRHPSASVNVETGKFHCFSCDFSGDGYDLIQRMEGCDFSAARTRAESIPDACSGGVSESDDGRSPWLPRKAGNNRGVRGYTPPWLRSVA